MKQVFYGWKLMGVLWAIIALNFGFIYFGSIIMTTYMASDMQLDRKSLGLVVAAFGLCTGLSTPLVGYCVNKWGARNAIAIGILITIFAALVMATMVNSMIGVVINYGLIMGFGVALAGPLPIQTIITYWFRNRIAMALTIISTGNVAGGFVAAPLFDKVIAIYDGNWRAGWFAVAMICAVSFVAAILFVRNKPSDIGQFQDGIAPDGFPSATKADSRTVSGVYKTTEDWTLGEAVRHPTLWIMILGTVLFLVGYGMMVAHGVMHFKDLGHSAAMAAMFLGLLPLSGFAGKAVVAVLGDRIEPRFLWSGAMIVMSAGLALGVKATTDIELYATALLLGSGGSAAYPCMITLVANYYGKSSYASFMGVMLSIAAIAGATGPLVAGFVFDHFGSYALAFYPAAAISLLGGLMIAFMKPPLRAVAKPQKCSATHEA